MKAPRGRKRVRQGGFTLTELMVTVAIVGVIGAVAVPGYQSYTQQARRATAHAALQDLASRQEQFFLDNKTYTTTVGAGGLGANTTSEGGYYTVSAAAGGSCTIATCYVLSAVPQGSQAEDDCGTLTLTSGGDKSPSGCW